MNKMMIIFFLLILAVHMNAQTFVSPANLEVTINQTTNLIFPAAIVSVDRGSEHIIVQKSINNILRVKAESMFTDTTNLTIITSDGKLYSFLVRYAKYPVNLTINLGLNETVDQDTTFSGLAKRVLKMRNNLLGIKYNESKVQLSLLSVYTTGQVVVCKLKIENNSSLSYIIGDLRVMSQDIEAGKRRSTQEREIKPLQSFNPASVIREKGVGVLVIVLPKPSLNHSRSIHLEISEKEGERNLSLKIKNRFLLNAATIN